MSFEEETHAGLKATKRGKRPASLSAEPSDSVDSAGDHLDETFPFETRLVGKYWVTAIVLQAVLYISCFVAATMPLGVEAGSWADSVPDGEEEAGEGTQQSPFESFIYFIVTWLLLYQIREIRPHVRAASEDELSYLKSESLQEKMKAIKRMKWHQTMCFVPQPLMAIDALVGSMGAGILVFRYAAMKTGCATGITDGLEQLDVVGVALLFVMALCVGLVIALLYIVARIHVAHFMAIQDTEAAREYLMDTEHTPRGSPKGMASRSLLRWYGFCIALQVVLLGMLSVAKDVVTEEGKEGSVGMAKTLYVLIGIGIFYLGQQAGHINDYMRHVQTLDMTDTFRVAQRTEWHNRNMFAPTLIAIIQSFVMFPSSFALLPFFTVEGKECQPGQSVFADLGNLTGMALFGYGAAFVAFGVLQLSLLKVSVMHFRAVKSLHDGH